MTFDKTEFMLKNLGGNAYWRLLLDSGVDKDQISELIKFYTGAGRDKVIAFMGGAAVVESMDRAWQEPMIVLSALRMVVEEYLPGYGYSEPRGRI